MIALHFPSVIPKVSLLTGVVVSVYRLGSPAASSRLTHARSHRNTYVLDQRLATSWCRDISDVVSVCSQLYVSLTSLFLTNRQCFFCSKRRLGDMHRTWRVEHSLCLTNGTTRGSVQQNPVGYVNPLCKPPFSVPNRMAELGKLSMEGDGVKVLLSPREGLRTGGREDVRRRNAPPGWEWAGR